MSIHVYRVPDGETLTSNLVVTADNMHVPVHTALVSKVPYNRRWPGHQRTIDQAEEAYFVSFASDASVTLTVRPEKPFSEVIVRPLSKQVVPSVTDGVISFTLPSPGGYTLELDGSHNALHIFFDPPETRQPSEGNEVIRFADGIFEIGTMELKSNQSVYIAEDAIVYGSFLAENAENIEILGRGILDNSKNKEEILFEMETLGDGQTDVRNSVRHHTIDLIHTSHVLIDGITIRDSLVYNVATHGGYDITVDNIKIIGCWRYNSDGIDFHNSVDCVVRNCFVRTFDDAICVKGHMGYGELSGNVLVENCVVWCDWDHTLEIGAEVCAENLQNVTFRNCDLIHNMHTALSIVNVDYGHVHDILYADIRVEYDAHTLRPMMQPNDITPYDENLAQGEFLPTCVGFYILMHHEYSEGRNERGKISNVRIRNLQITAPMDIVPPLCFQGYDAEHGISDVKFEQVTVNGKEVNDFSAFNLRQNEFCTDIAFA